MVLDTSGAALAWRDAGVKPAAPRRSGAPQPQRGSGAAAGIVPAVAVLLLWHYRPGHAWWALSRLVRGPRALGDVPGLRFARVMGSGRGGGFGAVPSWRHQGLIAFFDGEDSAQAFIAGHPVVQACRARAQDWLALTLRATSSRGSWAGTTFAVTAEATPGQPIAALTRASIRPSRMVRFWRHSPPSEASLAAARGCRLAVGLGEAPLLRQCTFSLWDDQASMDAYARQGAHQAAIRASYQGDFFSEWMFVRFVVLRSEGAWPGWPRD
jgi:hypothetical protein